MALMYDMKLNMADIITIIVYIRISESMSYYV